MSFYAAEADLNLSEQRLIELTDSESAVGTKDAALIARMHTRANSKINAALYGKYAVDPDDIPPILTEIEADFWRFYLYEHREVMAIPPTVQNAYNYSEKLLEEYRTGTQLLDAPSTVGSDGAASSVGSFSDDSVDRVFGRAKDGLF